MRGSLSSLHLLLLPNTQAERGPFCEVTASVEPSIGHGRVRGSDSSGSGAAPSGNPAGVGLLSLETIPG